MKTTNWLRLFFLTIALVLITPAVTMAKRPLAGVVPTPSSSFFLKSLPKKPVKVVPGASQDMPGPTYVYPIDNFQDGNTRAWWTFGELDFDLAYNGQGEIDPLVSGRSLRFQGKTKNWVVGGTGRYIGVDAAQFNSIKLLLKSNHKKGDGPMLTLELYVAPNGNWMIKNPEARDYKLKYEYKFTHSLHVDWKGWKMVTIPFKNFLPGSPRVAHRLWDSTTNVSAGHIIQLQLIVLAPEKKGAVDFQLGSLSLAKDPGLDVVPDNVLDF